MEPSQLNNNPYKSAVQSKKRVTAIFTLGSYALLPWQKYSLHVEFGGRGHRLLRDGGKADAVPVVGQQSEAVLGGRQQVGVADHEVGQRTAVRPRHPPPAVVICRTGGWGC